MWRAHMTLHAQGILPGVVPTSWLEENDSYICPHCSQLVADSRMTSHSRKCSGAEVTQFQITNQPSISNNMSFNIQPAVILPTFEEVCQLNLPTLWFIPSKSWPAFARSLSSALRCVIQRKHGSNYLCFLSVFCLLQSVVDAMKSSSQ